MTTAFAARHTCDSPEWYTPSPFVEAARTVMGAIDLDPASHEEANRTVKAARFFDRETNGLRQEWHGRAFVNPPGGEVANFWNRMMHQWRLCNLDQAVWIGYSLEQLQTLQISADGGRPGSMLVAAYQTPLDFSMCVPRRRIAFVENEAKRAERVEKLIAAGKTPNQKSQPSHANYITYLGTNKDEFSRVFSQFGQVVLR